MKNTLIVLVLAAVAINYSNAGALRERRQLVPSEFRNINIETYLKNPRSVMFQLKCIVYDGPCDRIGKYLKVTIPDLITGNCAHCTPSDRQTAGRLIAHIQKNFPKEWHDAVRKFQGGQNVKPEDVNRFESLLGVKLESSLISTEAPAAVVAPAVVPSSTAAPAVQTPVSSAPTPVVAPVAPVAVVEEKKSEPVVVAAPAVQPPSAGPVVVVPAAADPVVPTEVAIPATA